MALRTLNQLDMAGKRVLVRADLNVPMADGEIADPARIRAAAPTIKEILERGGIPIVMSHLGRPKGERKPTLSLRMVQAELSEALGEVAIRFAEDIGGVAPSDVGQPKAESVVEQLQEGEVLLLENLRFYDGETENDPAFARALAQLGDAYVNDAFSASHREHASIVGVPKLLPAAAGRLMERELRSLEEHLSDPARPYVALLGGAKVSSKFRVLRALVGRVDTVILAGGMANTFLAAEGTAIGKSIRQDDAVDEARRIREAAAKSGCEIVLPPDVVVAREMEADAPSETVAVGNVPDDAMILDLGRESVARIVECIEAARAVVWNGPLGAAEVPGFECATHRVAACIAERTRQGGLTSVAGGGDTDAALAEAGVREDFTYVSLAGGAFLEWLEGKEMPGVSILMSDEQSPAS